MAHRVATGSIKILAPGILNKPDPATNEQGFTLLEILVVVVIAAIIFSLSTLAIRGTTPEELLQTEARRLDRLLQLAQEEAILRGEEYGLEFGPQSYRFLIYVDNDWRTLQHDKLLRELDITLQYPDLDAGLGSCFTD